MNCHERQLLANHGCLPLIPVQLACSRWRLWYRPFESKAMKQMAKTDRHLLNDSTFNPCGRFCILVRVLGSFWTGLGGFLPVRIGRDHKTELPSVPEGRSTEVFKTEPQSKNSFANNAGDEEQKRHRGHHARGGRVLGGSSPPRCAHTHPEGAQSRDTSQSF